MASAGKRGRLAWFEFFADDFIAGTADLSLEEVGLYIKLLSYQWSKGAVLADPDRMARVAGVDRDTYVLIFAGISDKFIETPEGLVNPRLGEQRAETTAKVGEKLNRLQGPPIGNPKRGKNRTPIGTPFREPQKGDSETPTGIEKTAENGLHTRARARGSGSCAREDQRPPSGKRKNTQAPPHEYPEPFQRFWDAFPKGRRTKKPDALRAWRKALAQIQAEYPDADADELLILRAIDYAKSAQGRSKFVRGPAPWLNQSGWDDPPEAWARGDDPPNGRPPDDDPRGNKAALQRYLAKLDEAVPGESEVTHAQ